MNCLNRERANKIASLVREVEKLSDTEKLLLYLQLPYGRAESSDGTKHKLNNVNNQKQHNQSGDIFAKKSDLETTQTYTWILSHLEEDPNVSLPKQEVYDEYRAFCQTNRFEPLCVADFGKAMKHALPCIKPRRLGQRGNSRYCYSGLRKKYRLEAPSLPNLIITSSGSKHSDTYYSNDNNNSLTTTTTTTTPIKTECIAAPPPQPPTQTTTTTSSFTSCSQTSSTAGSCTYTPQHPSHTGSGGGAPVRCKLEPCTIGSGGANGAPPLPECCRPQTATDYQHHNHLQPLLTQQQAAGSYGMSQQPEVFAQHRCASPDDDEYGHNYHDLNRPIVGAAVIPFSQSLPAQVAQQPAAANQAFISYTNGGGGGGGGSVHIDAHHSQQQHGVHHAPSGMQQKVQGACCEQQQDQKMAHQNSCSPLKQDNDSSSSSPSNNQFTGNNSLHHHHQQHQHQQHQHQHQHHEHNDALHLNLSLLDHCAASSHMDFCTSPFQSPASTPYPRHEPSNYTTGSGHSDSLVQDYYQSASSSDQLGGLQYADLHH